MIRLFGSAVPQQLDVQQFYGQQQELDNTLPLEDSAILQSSDRVIKRKGRTLLTDKSTRPTRPDGKHTLDKIPEKSFKKTSNTPGDKLDETAQKLKAMNLSGDELAFLKEYRRLEDLEREKGIKFFECVGDPPATELFVSGIKVKRQNFIEKNLDEMRE